MSLIAFIAPDMSLFESARQLFKTHHSDIHIVKGLLHEGVAIATALRSKGTEIIISRGGTATAIRNAGLEITVVEIPITGFDIIRTVEKANRYWRIYYETGHAKTGLPLRID